MTRPKGARTHTKPLHLVGLDKQLTEKGNAQRMTKFNGATQIAYYLSYGFKSLAKIKHSSSLPSK